MTAAQYRKLLGERLRAARQERGLSLVQVQIQSRGQWNPQTLGSYERGDRAITVERLAELAAFYGVPVTGLFPADPAGDQVPA